MRVTTAMPSARRGPRQRAGQPILSGRGHGSSGTGYPAARVGRADPGPLMPLSPQSFWVCAKPGFGLGRAAGFPSGERRHDDAPRIPRTAEEQEHSALPLRASRDGRPAVMPAELQRVYRAVLDGVGLPRRCGLWWRGAGPSWWPRYPPGKQHRMDNGIIIAAAILCPIACTCF